MLTGKQNSIFRPLVEKAWSALCVRNSVSLSDEVAHKAWYRKVLVMQFGFYSTKQVPADNSVLFDELCLHFATLSGDEREIGYWSAAEERRAMWRLTHTMENAGVGWPYVLAIARNMGFDVSDDTKVHELPAEHILKLNTAVYLYMKRQEREQKDPALAEVPF